jgi:hypothetical protein
MGSFLRTGGWARKAGKEQGEEKEICLDRPVERVYYSIISCKEFWFGTNTSR